MDQNLAMNEAQIANYDEQISRVQQELERQGPESQAP